VKQWVVLEDFNQFGAIADTFCGRPAPSPQGSDLLRELTGGHRLVLTENKRSDPELFDFITGLLSNTQDLQENLLKVRQPFPLQNRPARYSLSISHCTRIRVNRLANERERKEHPEAILLKVGRVATKDNNPQSMWIWPGQELIGAGGKAKKGLFYRVTSCTQERVVLEGNGETPLGVSAENAVKHLRLTHCLTYASCQGLSLVGVRLLETESPHFSWRHLYVGASRCTSSRLLEVA